MNDRFSPALEWDDLRHLMAVAEGGNLVEGAKLLGVNHSTVLRRLAVLESRLGGPLFVRKGRYVPTRLGEHALAAAKAMSAQVEHLDFSLAQGLQPLAGAVELVVQHAFLTRMVWPYIAEFLDAHPAVTMAVVTAPEHVQHRHVDVVLGVGDAPPFGQVQRLREVRWCAYASSMLAARWKMNAEGVAAPRTFIEVLAAPRACAQWLAKQSGGAPRPRLTVNTLDDARLAATQGLGVALLPTIIGQMFPSELIAVSDVIDRLTEPAWISVQPRAIAVPRFVSLVEFLASRLAADTGW